MSQLMDRTDMPLGGFLPEVEGFETLKTLREKALQDHLVLGIPTTKDEEWKYTSLRNLSEQYFTQSGRLPVTEEQMAPYTYGDLEQIRIVFINGHYDEGLTTSLSHVPGLTIKTLQCASDTAPNLIENLGKFTKTEEFTFGALNTAKFLDGVVIHLAKNTVVETPIHVLNLTTADVNNATGISTPRILVLAETGSKATVLETYASIGTGATLSNAVVEVLVEANACIEHVKVTTESLDSTHIGLTNVMQERDSTYLHYNVILGGRLTRNDINIFLNGSNVHTRMDGVTILDGNQHADNHTRLDHAYPHCDSFEVYKHVLGGDSTGVFNGKIFVHQDAQKTDAKQTNQTLLMSPTATINSKPQLEIFADDVKCTHGATVGCLDQMPLFYLQTRGIPQKRAEAIMVYAFAAEVLERISNTTLRARLEELLYEKLAVESQA